MVIDIPENALDVLAPREVMALGRALLDAGDPQHTATAERMIEMAAAAEAAAGER
jgi:hypothetical protein